MHNMIVFENDSIGLMVVFISKVCLRWHHLKKNILSSISSEKNWWLQLDVSISMLWSFSGCIHDQVQLKQGQETNQMHNVALFHRIVEFQGTPQTLVTLMAVKLDWKIILKNRMMMSLTVRANGPGRPKEEYDDEVYTRGSSPKH